MGGGVLDNRQHERQHVNIGNGVGAGSSDEDPYSVAGSGSSSSTGNGNSRNRSSSRDCPPQLPPRDNGIYSLGPNAHAWSNVSSNEDQEQNSRQENKKQKERNRPNQGQFMDSSYSSGPTSLPSHPFWWHSRIYQDQGCGNGAGGGDGSGFTTRAPTSFVPYVTDSSDSDYSHIYGRLPLVNRAIRKFPTKPLFLSQWE